MFQIWNSLSSNQTLTLSFSTHTHTHMFMHTHFQATLQLCRTNMIIFVCCINKGKISTVFLQILTMCWLKKKIRVKLFPRILLLRKGRGIPPHPARRSGPIHTLRRLVLSLTPGTGHLTQSAEWNWVMFMHRIKSVLWATYQGNNDGQWSVDYHVNFSI